MLDWNTENRWTKIGFWLEVRIVDLEKETIYDTDVLVMGTDGLWDVSNNDKVADVVHNSLEQFPSSDEARYRYRFTSAAQDLVMSSRGKLNDRSWRTSENKSATIDDISVFVIPLAPYKEDWKQWKQMQSSATEPSVDSPIQPSGYVSFGNPIASSNATPSTTSSTPVEVEDIPIDIPIEELEATTLSSSAVEEVTPVTPVAEPLKVQKEEQQHQVTESIPEVGAAAEQLPLDNQEEEELLVQVTPKSSDPVQANRTTETDQQS